jgi:hypothetical protein
VLGWARRFGVMSKTLKAAGLTSAAAKSSVLSRKVAARMAAVEQGIAITNVGQAAYATFQNENGQAVGYLGEAMLRLLGARSIKANTSQVFRVDEDLWPRVHIGDGGSVEIPTVLTKKGKGPERSLFVNVDQKGRAFVFLNQRAGQGKPASIKVFEVDGEYAKRLRRDAVLEGDSAKFGSSRNRVRGW